MSRAPSTFRQADLTRAVRAVRAAGCEVARVEVENGKIIVVTGKAPVDSDGVGTTNPLIRKLRERGK